MASDVERNKAIVERYYGELNRGNLAVVDELIEETYIAHDPSLPADMREGIDKLKIMIERTRAAFPDQRIELDDMIGEGDRVACRLKFVGHLVGEWDGHPYDGREVSFTGMGMYRIADGKIAEGWFNFDQHGFMRQLGALPSDTRDPDDVGDVL
jgi:steroid delta-isomerase-like uncharacterized protein